MPYRELAKPIVEDRRKVIEFAAYTCPVCQQTHGAIAAWAKTLPKSLTFETVIIPLRDDDFEFNLLVARAIVMRSHPSVIPVWDSAVFDALYAGTRDLKEVIATAVKISGLVRVDLSDSKGAVDLSLEWIEKARKYEIRKTPTIAIGGRFTASQDDVSDVPEAFGPLLNGLVSAIL